MTISETVRNNTVTGINEEIASWVTTFEVLGSVIIIFALMFGIWWFGVGRYRL